MIEKYLDKLEYNKIVEIISEYCNTYIGKELAASLKPSFNFSEVQVLLAETTEAVNLSIRKSHIPLR